MDVTLLGMIVFLHPTIKVFVDFSMIALQLLRESYVWLPFSTFMEIRPLQPVKPKLLMDVTLLGMVTEVKPLQSQKAEELIEVTL